MACSLVPDSSGGATLSFGKDVLHLPSARIQRSSVLQHLLESHTGETQGPDNCNIAGLQQQHLKAWIHYLNKQVPLHQEIPGCIDVCLDGEPSSWPSLSLAEALLVRNLPLYPTNVLCDVLTVYVYSTLFLHARAFR